AERLRAESPAAVLGGGVGSDGRGGWFAAEGGSGGGERGAVHEAGGLRRGGDRRDQPASRLGVAPVELLDGFRLGGAGQVQHAVDPSKCLWDALAGNEAGNGDFRSELLQAGAHRAA